jgi:50S ribosomal protein L16 3-hydroxylase
VKEVRATVKYPLLGMTKAKFLNEYWQQKPLLVRNALANFNDPLSPDELAGLACEDEIESRLIERRRLRSNQGWRVTWGPLEESRFAELGESNWTLLVQELNRWVPDAALLLEPFAFVPNVRVDDVMVSFATPGGGVGAHVDSYDVFLVQGQGKRLWRVGGEKLEDPAFIPNIALKILRQFTPASEAILESGDMLYLPPGFAHDGIAETECMTYSVGFRAPRTSEVWSAFANDAASRLSDSRILVDPLFRPDADPGEIPLSLRQRVRAMVRSMGTSDRAIDDWYARYSTMIKPDHPAPEVDKPLSQVDLIAHLRFCKGTKAHVARSEEIRFAWIPPQDDAPNELLYYIGGEQLRLPFPSRVATLAQTVARKRRFTAKELLLLVARSDEAEEFLTELFAKGALEFI